MRKHRSGPYIQEKLAKSFSFSLSYHRRTYVAALPSLAFQSVGVYMHDGAGFFRAKCHMTMLLILGTAF